VLLVCSPRYRSRFDRQAEEVNSADTEDADRGAAWEALITEQLLYETGGLNHKLIPVLLDDGTRDDVPVCLRAFTRYHLPRDYDDLYRRLTNQPKVAAPPVGPRRTMAQEWIDGVPEPIDLHADDAIEAPHFPSSSVESGVQRSTDGERRTEPCACCALRRSPSVPALVVKVEDGWGRRIWICIGADSSVFLPFVALLGVVALFWLAR
jgi:hypothetical protein